MTLCNYSSCDTVFTIRNTDWPTQAPAQIHFKRLWKKAKVKNWSHTRIDWAMIYIHAHRQHQHRDTHLLTEWQCFHGESAGVTSSPPCVVRVTMEMLCSDGVCARAHMYICYIIWKHTTRGFFGLFQSFFFGMTMIKDFVALFSRVCLCVSVCVCVCVLVGPVQRAPSIWAHVWPAVGWPPGRLWQWEDPGILWAQHSQRLLLFLQVADRTETQLPGRWSHLKSEYRQYNLRD